MAEQEGTFVMRKLILALAALAMSVGGLLLASGPAYACIPCSSSGTGTACCGSPIILDVNGSGFHLTSAANGVRFDFFGTGHQVQMAWIAPGSTDAFLVLPRDGKVTSGRELFGNLTPQPRSAHPNGFAALASLNTLTGGRDRAVIDSRDPLYYRLRLWQFTRHDGSVVTGKLSTLPQLGIKAIYLDYRATGLADRYGNQFRYRVRVVSSNPHAAKYAYDVFLRYTAAPAVRPATTATRAGALSSGLLAVLVLIPAGLLLAIQPARRRRARMAAAPAADMRPVPGKPQPDLTSKS